MNFKFYLEKLHENEIEEDEDFDELKEYIENHVDFKTILAIGDFITINSFLRCFTLKQLNEVYYLINNGKKPRCMDTKYTHKLSGREYVYYFRNCVVGKYKIKNGVYIYPYFYIGREHES